MSLDEAIEAEAQAQAICMAAPGLSARPSTPSWRSARRASAARRRAHEPPRLQHQRRGPRVLLRRAPRAPRRRRARAGARRRRCSPTTPRGGRRPRRAGAAAGVCAGLRRRPRGAHPDAVDVRAVCLVREALGYASGLADTVFAMQGLGSYPIVLAGTDAQRREYLPPVLAGRSLAAFAITEEEAGSDVAAMQTTAARDGDGWVLDGAKTFISNAGIAGHYVVFANADPPARAQGDHRLPRAPDDPGFVFEGPIPLMADHPHRARSASRVPARRRPAARRGGRRVSHRHDHARRLPQHRGRGRAGDGAAGARRGPRPHAEAAAVRQRAERVSVDAGLPRGDGHGARRRAPAGLPRGLGEGPGRPARHARGEPWARCTRPRPRSASSTAPSSSTAGSGRGRRQPLRAALPRGPRAAHLRGHDGDPAPRHRRTAPWSER
jgi:hypothetical protein